MAEIFRYATMGQHIPDIKNRAFVLLSNSGWFESVTCDEESLDITCKNGDTTVFTLTGNGVNSNPLRFRLYREDGSIVRTYETYDGNHIFYIGAAKNGFLFSTVTSQPQLYTCMLCRTDDGDYMMTTQENSSTLKFYTCHSPEASCVISNSCNRHWAVVLAQFAAEKENGVQVSVGAYRAIDRPVTLPIQNVMRITTIAGRTFVDNGWTFVSD